MGTVSVQEGKEVLETDGGDGCPMEAYLTPMTYTLKNGQNRTF